MKYIIKKINDFLDLNHHEPCSFKDNMDFLIEIRDSLQKELDYTKRALDNIDKVATRLGYGQDYCSQLEKRDMQQRIIKLKNIKQEAKE